MKQNYMLCLVGCILYVCSACEEYNTVLLSESNSTQATSDISRMQTDSCYTEVIPNQLVVKYKRRTKLSKERIRARYGVKEIKKCSCADESLELWDFGHDNEGLPINIEEKKQVAQTDPDLEGVNANFILNTTGTSSFYYSGSLLPPGSLYTSETGVGIAILDTGIQFDHDEFDSPFLYNSPENSVLCSYNEYKEKCGWDFVNEDNDAIDDNGHGTIVTSIIYKGLQALNVRHSILPVKIFNTNGQGSYFNLLCGYKFAESKPGIKIINMSFGWCGDPFADEEQPLLQRFITETEVKGEILLVTSAGNNSLDNDIIPHYPSSYSNTNVLSITSMNQGLTGLASFACYGATSVDFAAMGEDMTFAFNDETQVVSGTSFATAFATVKAAMLLSSGEKLEEIEEKINGDATHMSTLNAIKHAAMIEN